MLLLTGEYQHVLDDKSRVLISNKLRSQIDVDEYGSAFYLVLGANGILCLYPEKCFERIIQALASQPIPADEMVEFERMSFALANKVELDNQGRLLINEKLKKRAGLGNNITLVGARDHIELWDTQTWEKYVEDNMPRFQQQMAEARKAVLQKQSQENLTL